ncbi:MAG TPA: hypothetical protein VKA45_14390 [Gaiellaceae bacterium]|nr:hypothetical protein [Gaiellaceae bacterium]
MRPSGILVVAASLAALFAVGAGSAADTKRGFFDITVSGEITKRWTYVENNPDTECKVRRSFRGRETFTFRSRRPTRVLVRSRSDASLVFGAVLRNISGTYVQTGTRAARSLNAACPNPVTYSTRCTPPRMIANRGGTVSITAPRKGLIRLAKLRLSIRVPRALTACEPRAVAALPTRAELASARANAGDVFDPKARAVDLDAGASETTVFSGGDTGRATVDVSWTVSFERVGS